MSLGERLRKEREKRGWTQLYVAKKLGIPNQNLSNYERDFRSPDTENLIALADLYHVTTDYLLGRSKLPHMSEEQSTSLDTIREIREKIATDRATHNDGSPLSEQDKQILLSQIDMLIRLRETENK